MTATLAPPMFSQFLNQNNSGSPAIGYKLFTYIAGTNTKQATWTDSTQVAQNANPLLLDGNGVGTFWGDPTLAYKFVWAPANDTDPPSSPIRSVDNLYFPLTLAALTQSVLGGILYPANAAEGAASVTPVNYAFAPGVDLRYGVVRDDATDNQTALTNCINVCKQASGPLMILTAGVARHSGTLNWGFQGLQVQSQANSFLRYTGGAGVANLIDGGAASSIDNLVLDGLYELGNANATYCWDIRSVHRSSVRLSGKNCTLSGFRWRFGVENQMDLTCSQNDGVGNFTTQPVNGVIFDVRNAGEGIAFPQPSNIVVEGVSGTGLLFQNSAGSGTSALGGQYSGTSEGNGSGVATDANSRLITFINFDCEGNTSSSAGCDWNLQGELHQLINTNSTSSAATDSTTVSNSEQITFNGGFHRSVALQSSALDTLFLNFGTSDNGALGIHGAGVYRQVNTVRYNTATPAVATIHPNDKLGAVANFTATLTGCTTSPTGSVTYSVNGDLVTLDIPPITATSNTTAATLTGVPAALIPTTTQKPIGLTVNSGATSVSTIQVNTDGTITLFNGTSATFTNTGTKGVDSCTITYRLST